MNQALIEQIKTVGTIIEDLYENQNVPATLRTKAYGFLSDLKIAVVQLKCQHLNTIETTQKLHNDDYTITKCIDCGTLIDVERQ
jgi:RNA polymerase-binding transcription factor DksA